MARWRCLAVGCNPTLSEKTALAHKEKTGHRVAAWPVRSAAGQQAQRERNQTSGRAPWRYEDAIHPFSEEAFE